MGGTFQKYLGEDQRSEDEVLSFRQRAPSLEEDELAIEYEPRARRDDRGDMLDEDPIITVKKEGKSLLMHNMICSAVAAASGQLHSFFRRLVQR